MGESGIGNRESGIGNRESGIVRAYGLMHPDVALRLLPRMRTVRINRESGIASTYGLMHR
ncbi:hypothetical protein XnspCFBP7698_08440 [Xanthomonas sp. CFBP 7698]|nr:hypothetical protein XnspCFBP7698_08440 [Xanthomonas sp. CFBP 7698]